MRLREVTQDEFFSALRADPRDIMPRPEVDHSLWRDQRTEQIFGKSLPGWKNPGDRKTYFLVVKENQ